MEVLARAAVTVIEPGIVERQRSGEIRQRLQPLLDGAGLDIAFQPIVDLGNGARVGAEALSRFPVPWDRAPDVIFAEATSIGVGPQLELLAVRQATARFPDVSGYIAINLSPATLLENECLAFLRSLPASRTLLELSEHDPVEDYPALIAALAPLRQAGLRLAIDDVGAGFSSLRHIVMTAPDVMKLDRSIVDGIAADPVLQTLVRSLVEFGHGCGAKIVAEGIETAADVLALRLAQVDYGQGWYFARAARVDQLRDHYPIPNAPPDILVA